MAQKLNTHKMKKEVPTADEAKRVVMDKIKKAAERWSKGDTMGYVECAAEDIVWVDELGAQKPVIGIEKLRTYLSGFKGKVPAHEFKLSGHYFQVYDNMVVVSYRYQGILDGQPLPPWKVSSVYRYINGDWVSVHENWTKVKEN